MSSDQDTRSFIQQTNINVLKKAAELVEAGSKYNWIRKVCLKSGLWKTNGEKHLRLPTALSIDCQ